MEKRIIIKTYNNMKRIFTILLTAGTACIFSQTSSAQSLKDLFSKDNIKNVVENVTGLDLSKDEAVITHLVYRR